MTGVAAMVRGLKRGGANSRYAAIAMRLARLIQRIAEIQKRQLYKALSPHKDPVSRPLHSPDRREFRFVHTLWSPKPAAVRLCLR
jgi:hypothetical protein